MKKLDMHLVLAALDSLSKSSSPGVDGIPASVYWAVKELFAPHVLDISHQALAAGRTDDSWVVALLNPIPKSARGR